MGVKFNSTACMAAFREHVIATLILIQQEYLAEVEANMLTRQGIEELTANEIVVLGDYILANITGGPWATMDEWGTGSKMDTSNPALDAYKNSNMWNPDRFDNVIRSRSREQNNGDYIDIFGNPIQSKSNIGGVDLEISGKVYAQPPSHAMQTAGRWMANGRIQIIWHEAMMAFPWGSFIIVTPD